MIRILISILCAIGLALAPVAPSAAAMLSIEMPSADMPDCSMDGKMPASPTGHSRTDCCASVCQAQSPALLPDNGPPEPADSVRAALLDWAPARELVSIANSGLDPPPRA